MRKLTDDNYKELIDLWVYDELTTDKEKIKRNRVIYYVFDTSTISSQRVIADYAFSKNIVIEMLEYCYYYKRVNFKVQLDE